MPRYAVADVAAAHGLRAAWRYLADMAGAGHGRTGEFAAMAGGVLPAGPRTRAYVAVTWPEWCSPQASPILAARWRDKAVNWAQQWVAVPTSAAVGLLDPATTATIECTATKMTATAVEAWLTGAVVADAEIGDPG